MKNKLSYWLLFLICFTYDVFPIHSSAGSVNYQHLLLHYDGRSAGMAGANVALPGGIEGAVANPAVIASTGLRKDQAFIGAQAVFDGVWCSPISYLRSYEFGVVAVTLQGLSSGDINETGIDKNDNPIYVGRVAHSEYFTPSISFARPFLQSRLLAGVSVKGMYQRITAVGSVFSSKGIGFDAGIQYRISNDRFVVGAVFRNVGFEIQSFNDDVSYPLPTVFEAGISYVPQYAGNIRIGADINKTRGDYLTLEPGMEIELYPRTLFVRAGYPFSRSDFKEQLERLTGDKNENYVKSNWSTFAFGFGIKHKIKKSLLQFDAGVQLRDEFDPAFIYSAVVDF